MEWLAYDEVPLDALPDWARGQGEVLDGGPYDVRVRPEGLVLEAPGRGVGTALRWDEVLVPIRLDDPRRLLIAAARKPPRPPWLELGGSDVAKIERVLRARLEAVDHRSYREHRRARVAMPPDEVLTQVLARRPLPGAVEIPAATPGVLRSVLTGAGVGGLLGSSGLIYGPLGFVTATAMGALSGAGLFGGVELLRQREAGRVLVLTPDAFVGGLDGQSVRAVPRFRVGRFAEGVGEGGEPALEVFGADGELLARVAARYFGRPLDVIVAVAEAYRRRASTESSSRAEPSS